MTFIERRITILRIRRPAQLGLNDELQWLGSSLGLFGERDRDKTCFRVFLELLKAAKRQRGLTSDEIGELMNISRPTVVHHLTTLMERGMIVHDRRQYILRAGHLHEVINRLQQDAQETLKELEETARALDDVLER